MLCSNNMKKISTLLLAAVILLSSSSVCFSDGLRRFHVTPALTHNAKTFGDKSLTLDINYTYETEKIYVDSSRIFTHEVYNILTYGINKDLDISVNVPFEAKIYTNKDNYAGIDDMDLSLKWRFFSRDSFHLAVLEIVSFPTGNFKAGDGRGRSTYTTKLIATKDLGPVTITANGQYKRNENKAKQKFNIWKTGINAETKITDSVSFLGNIELKNDKTKANLKTLVILSTGFSWKVHKLLTITPIFEAELNEGETDITYCIGTSWKF